MSVYEIKYLSLSLSLSWHNEYTRKNRLGRLVCMEKTIPGFFLGEGEFKGVLVH